VTAKPSFSDAQLRIVDDALASDLRCAAHRGNSKFRVRCFTSIRNDGSQSADHQKTRQLLHRSAISPSGRENQATWSGTRVLPAKTRMFIDFLSQRIKAARL
jgi:hypothetical protein